MKHNNKHLGAPQPPEQNITKSRCSSRQAPLWPTTLPTLLPDVPTTTTF